VSKSICKHVFHVHCGFLQLGFLNFVDGISHFVPLLSAGILLAGKIHIWA